MAFVGGCLLIYSGWTRQNVLDVLTGVFGPPTPNPTQSVSTGGTTVGAGATVAGGGITQGLAGLLPGVSNFDGKPVANWIIPYLQYGRQHGWKGHVTSGFRTKAEQTRICAQTSGPCAKPGTSNHEQSSFPGGAVDVTDAPTLAKILQNYPGGSQLIWAGSKDPVHFSHPHGGGY